MVVESSLIVWYVRFYLLYSRVLKRKSCSGFRINTSVAIIIPDYFHGNRKFDEVKSTKFKENESEKGSKWSSRWRKFESFGMVKFYLDFDMVLWWFFSSEGRDIGEWVHISFESVVGLNECLTNEWKFTLPNPL